MRSVTRRAEPRYFVTETGAGGVVAPLVADFYAGARARHGTMREPMSDAQPKTVPYKKNDNRVRVLIADDNRDTVLMLGILLRSEGYEVCLAHTGAEAISQADQFRPHIALLDLQMPDCTGFQVAEHLSRQYNGQWPVLIAVTASTDQTDKHRAELSGFHQFVSKPYRHQSLLALLNAFRS